MGLTRVVNIEDGTPCDVYIGRGGVYNGVHYAASIWGNPYADKGIPREQRVRAFETHLLKRPDLLRRLHELRGKVLGCHCLPKACHGHKLAEYANTVTHAELQAWIDARLPVSVALGSQRIETVFTHFYQDGATELVVYETDFGLPVRELRDLKPVGV